MSQLWCTSLVDMPRGVTYVKHQRGSLEAFVCKGGLDDMENLLSCGSVGRLLIQASVDQGADSQRALFWHLH